MRDLGSFRKASADHVLAFRPCPRIGLAIVSVFTVNAILISSVFYLRAVPEGKVQALRNQEVAHVSRR